MSIIRCISKFPIQRQIFSASTRLTDFKLKKKMYNSGNFGSDGGGDSGGSGGGGGGFWTGVGPNNLRGRNNYDYEDGSNHFDDYQGGYNNSNNRRNVGYNNYNNRYQQPGPRCGGGGGGDFNNSNNGNRGFGGGRNERFQENQVLSAVMDLLGGGYNNEGYPRAHCGKLCDWNIGDMVELSGQLFRRNNRFAEIRDKTGVVQLIVDEEKNPEIAQTFKNIPDKTNIVVHGSICLRPRNARNESISNGDIEIEVTGFPKENNSNRHYRQSQHAPQVAVKRPYSTMSETNSLGVTLTEYKHANTESLLQYFINRDWSTAELTEFDDGKTIKIVGWLNEYNCVNKQFQKLKDGYGVIQLVTSRDEHQQIFEIAANSKLLVEVTGLVSKRPVNNINVKVATGAIEIQVEAVRALGPDDPYDGEIKFKKTKLENEEIITNQTAATNKFTYRTHNCNELTVKNVGENVTLCGWVQFYRLRKFIVLRDGYGLTQILIHTDYPEVLEQINKLTYESVIQVEGVVVPRPEFMKNTDQATGAIEVRASNINILNAAKPDLPMDIREHNKAQEGVRLTHRYIDLRSADMQYNLRTRSAVIMKMRECLINKYGFVEVETPTLFRRTPGGAQEFVVPTRKKGLFYSLVQSPQQFKQMLMSGGIDRYFQIARCYRDESGRHDRQPEFTQLDIELSFSNAKDVMDLMGEVITFCWPKTEFDHFKGLEFNKITYEDAMKLYGTDKPDTRFDWTLSEYTDIHPNAVYLILRGKEGNISNSSKQKINRVIKGDDPEKAKLFIYNYLSNPVELSEKLDAFTKNPGSGKEFLKHADLAPCDSIILAYGSDKTKVQELMGKVRLTYRSILEGLGICGPRTELPNKFLWVVDFPLFFKTKEGGFESAHHPFTAPHPDDLDKLNTKEDLENIRSQAYDLVLNGNEIAGGSIRIHDARLQRMVLDDILKIPHDHMQHLLDALESGCPPHGGIALGVDRFISIICKASTIKDVIAFPKTNEGRDLMSKAPLLLSEADKKLYHISAADTKKPEKVGETVETDDKADDATTEMQH